MWQDYILAVGAFLFSLALIPTIRSKQKPALTTSVLTSAVLWVFAITYATLELWLATVAQILGAGLWGFLAVQTVRLKKK